MVGPQPETAMADEFAHLKEWIGRTQDIDDVIDPVHVANMAATLDLDAAPRQGDPLPPGWHWTFFNRFARAREVAADGHAQRGAFLPPVALPRRMWAGGRLRFPGTLRVGEAVRRHSEILKVDVKRGRTGDLVFVVVRHQISGAAGLAVEEEHDIVYRGAPVPGAPAPTPQPAPTDRTWTQTIKPDPVLLFRYSALTHNGHRIHYDWPYVTKVEGYPSLIVHGPLTSTLLLELLRREVRRPLARYAFRAMAPLFDTAPFTVNGRMEADGSVKVWAAGPNGELAMEGTAVLA
jgi:3-methylfumaryl-CoA hydratase